MHNHSLVSCVFSGQPWRAFIDPLVLHRCMQCCRLIGVLQVWCSAAQGSRSLKWRIMQHCPCTRNRRSSIYDRKHVHTRLNQSADDRNSSPGGSGKEAKWIQSGMVHTASPSVSATKRLYMLKAVDNPGVVVLRVNGAHIKP